MTSISSARWTMVDPGPNLASIWDEVAARDPAATFFHTRTWAELLARTLPGHTIATVVYQRDDGKRAVLPAMKRQSTYGVFCVVASMLPEVYGGPICECDDPEGLSTMLELSRRKADELTIIGNPYSSWQFPEVFGTREITTHVMDLTQDEETLWGGVQSGWRRKIRRAEREGVTFEAAETEEDVRAYYEAYCRSRERWGDAAMAPYPLPLFVAMLSLPRDCVRIWLAKHDEKVLGGMVVFYHNHHAVYWHGAFLEEGLQLGGSNYLMWKAITDAKARGYGIFDFNPSAGLEGVIAFKEGFGPSLRRFQRGVARRPLFSFARSLKGRLT